MYSDKLGAISWMDLTVENAEQTKDFYQNVVGMTVESCAMGDYDDFVLIAPEDSNSQVGVCHARGPNKDIPAQWLPYFNVVDVEQSLKQTLAMGGTIVKEKTDMGSYLMCIVKDPSGAIAALVSPNPNAE